MILKNLTVVFLSLFISAIVPAGAAFANVQADRNADLSRAFSFLHAVSGAATGLSDLADQNAKSDLVKAYARAMSTANAKMDARIQVLAQKYRIEIAPLDPQTEAGKSLLARIKGEAALLRSLEGDAYDKEYMTLVTNTQQSAIRFLESRKNLSPDNEVRAFIADLITIVQNRLKTAQEVLAKVYADDF
ncbi:MAG TPA: DUF4142 domain-containing protein [Bdellovibrionota bacterium]|jgi:predicted outer membrane protein